MSRKDAQPSPKFTVDDTSIQANNSILIDPAPQARASKYKPFDGIQIQNASGEDIQIQLNDQDDNTLILESGSSMEKEFPQIQPFSTFRIQNLGGTAISDSDLRISYYKTGVGADKKAYQEATQSPLNKTIENLVGVNPSWL